MRLADLARECPGARCSGLPETEILGITADSRAAAPGFLFAALPGTKTDGKAFIADALARGAAAVLCDAVPEGCPVPVLVSPKPRLTLARAAEAFYGHPSRSLSLIGITGTNGKTTTAYLLRHILNTTGTKCGMIGTVEIDNGAETFLADMTTPDSVSFARLLADMVANGCRAAAVEVSSHALDQDRVGGSWFAGGVFTNLTRDHLDYHGTMEAYRDAKGRLFGLLGAHGFAVLNGDDPASEHYVRGMGQHLCRYGFAADAELAARDVRLSLEATEATLCHCGREARVRLPLIGRHNLANAMAALGAAVGAGVPFEKAATALNTARGAPGRLERIETELPLSIFVDYAHTDDALVNVLRIMRDLAPHKLAVVFGCGGDRDRGKRPLMAKAAAQCADRVYVTSDNPRTEQPEAIIDEIMTGFAGARANVFRDADRRRAIGTAVRNAEPGDVILIAGKGHECYQVVGTEKFPFDDHEVARRALADRRDAPGMRNG